MNKLAGLVAGALVSLAATGTAIAQPVSGQVGSGAPVDFSINLTVAQGGGVTVEPLEIRLAWGGYYRMNLNCPAPNVLNESGITWRAPEFLQNMHIRIVSVSDLGGGFQDVPEINFHMQGLNLRQIDCEGLGAAARISFHPMRRGTYNFTIIDDTVQPNREIVGQFIVE